MWSSVVNFILTVASMVPFFGPPPIPPVSDFRLGTNACLHPAERREWRTLSKAERVEWISAVKVESPFSPPCDVRYPHLVCYSAWLVCLTTPRCSHHTILPVLTSIRRTTMARVAPSRLEKRLLSRCLLVLSRFRLYAFGSCPCRTSRSLPRP